ncbi:MAG: tRNA 4-thiouridine(8) synthase ThiI [Anaerofustis stercorihominis]|nr:tRNA 4-thiouridine(8) synthase ThiI [Anaerofustis stercorihominis]
MDKRLILVKYGEITLKGLNQHYFLETLMKNIRYAIKGIEDAKVSKIQGRITINDVKAEDEAEVISRLKKVFGIVAIVVARECEADMDSIKAVALEIMKDKENCTFKAEAKRGNKAFPYTSPQIAKMVGAHVLVNTETITVDVHNPDYTLTVEVRNKAYVYCDDIPCEAGLPLGTGGSGALLLSGGIDSPVAGYMMNRRGMKICSIHFHSYPYTSLEAQKKATDLAQKLRPYNMGMTLINVSVTKIQEEIIQKCDESYLTVILRRFMFRIAEKICEQRDISALITGESLGQVASQTIESINCTNAVVSLPILRPLIAHDKNEIMALARHIDTYDISIRPFEDCCTVFVPKHPQIKPSLEKVELQESRLDVDALVQEALEGIEIVRIR